MMKSEPYISLVVTARNDDHGGNLLRRMQIFVKGLLEQIKKYDLTAELILVEWNPVPSRPTLYQALSWPEGPCKVRIIEVPSETHGRFRHSEGLPLFQMIAKNVGIRRAEGRFVLATNIDLLFSDELVRFLASKSLQPQFLYRIDRYDVSSDVPTDVTIEKQLEYCHDNVIRVNRRDGTYPRDAIGWIWAWKIGRGLRFLSRCTLSLFQPWSRAKLARGVKFLKRHMFLGYPRLHTNACGDFTLMAREHWHTLRGYPELEMHSFHLDSVFCHMAHQYGLREEVLQDPMRIYHIEHSSGWTPEGDSKMREHLRIMRIPVLDFPQFESWAIRMQKEKRPVVFNSEEWGLASENLMEITIDQDYCATRLDSEFPDDGKIKDVLK